MCTRRRLLYGLSITIILLGTLTAIVPSVSAKGQFFSRITIQIPGRRDLIQATDLVLLPTGSVLLSLDGLPDFTGGEIETPLVGTTYFEVTRYEVNAGSEEFFDHLRYYPGAAGKRSYILYEGWSVNQRKQWFNVNPDGEHALQRLVVATAPAVNPALEHPLKPLNILHYDRNTTCTELPMRVALRQPFWGC